MENLCPKLLCFFNSFSAVKEKLAEPLLKKMCVKFCFLANINEKSLYGHYKSRVVLSIQSQRLLNAQNELRCDFLIHLSFPGTETHVKYPTQANASSSGVSNLYGCISTDTSIKPEDCQVKAILQFPLF